MAGRRLTDTPVGRLRRRGVRVSAGPWTACGNTASDGRGRLIVALGKAAGKATTRSRIRRIAREVFAERVGPAAGIDLLLLARSDVDDHPRRQVRVRLRELMSRLSNTLTRCQADQAAHG
ncbi:MAG: ribonuclease P protein component [Candidatus Methylomirabilales bacterium]